jgi:hypothetical protein
MGVMVNVNMCGGHGGAAQDSCLQRGGVKDPRSGHGLILDAAPQAGEAWAEPWAVGGAGPPETGGYTIATFRSASASRSASSWPL